jgi:hypothetical protein
MPEIVNDDIFLYSIFSEPTARRENKFGNWFDQCTVIANSSQRLRGGENIRRLGPGNFSKEGFQTKQKDHPSLSTPACAQSSYVIFLTATWVELPV